MSKIENNGISKSPIENQRKSFVASEQQDTSHELQELREQLAASQAREQQLREALDAAQFSGNPYCLKVQAAIALPSDTTAIEAIVQKAVEVMRERCLDSAQAEMDEQYIDSSPWYAARACRETIRTVPTVTLDDLK